MAYSGIAGKNLFDMFCAGATADQIEACLYKYLPDAFGEAWGGYSETYPEKNLRIIDITVRTHSLDGLPTTCGVSVPDWADRISLSAAIRLRFKPKGEHEARMLLSISFYITAKSTGAPRKRKDLIKKRFDDIDKAIDEIKTFL